MFIPNLNSISGVSCRIGLGGFVDLLKQTHLFDGEIGEIYLLLTFGFQITMRRIFLFLHILTILWPVSMSHLNFWRGPLLYTLGFAWAVIITPIAKIWLKVHMLCLWLLSYHTLATCSYVFNITHQRCVLFKYHTYRYYFSKCHTYRFVPVLMFTSQIPL